MPLRPRARDSEVPLEVSLEVSPWSFCPGHPCFPIPLPSWAHPQLRVPPAPADTRSLPRVGCPTPSTGKEEVGRERALQVFLLD